MNAAKKICEICEDFNIEFGQRVRSGWTVWDTTINPAGEDVVDQFASNWEYAEVLAELQSRGFRVATKYVVLKEHTLGYLIPEWPNAIGILHASILRGSPYNDLDGWIYFNPNVDAIRAATPEDFKEYRVQLPSDFRHHGSV